MRGGWEGTRLDLPDGTWRDVLSDRTFDSAGGLDVAALLVDHHVALLVREDE